MIKDDLAYPLLFCLLLITLPFGANAQQLESEADRFLRDQKINREREELQRQQPVVITQQENEPSKFQDNICFTINVIDISGVKAFSSEVFESLKQPIISQCVGQNRIGELLNEINQIYMAKGYITTRAYLPEQNLSKGVLKIEVVEGTVEKVILNSDSTQDQRRLWAALPRFTEDSILNMRNLEQAVDQLDAPASVKTQIKLWPGEQVGTSLVEVTTKDEDDFRIRLSTDNDGQEGTGKNKLKLGVEKDNLFSINESISLNYIGSQDTNALIFQASIPFRRFNLSYTRSYSEYLSGLSEFSELFGQSDSSYLGLDYMAFRNGKHKLSLKSNLSVRSSNRYINDAELTPQNLTVFKLGLEHRYISEKSRWLSSINVSQGLDALSASTDTDIEGLANDAPHAQFSKLDANIHFSRPLGDSVYLQSLMVAQYSFDSLYGSEQVHLGGLGSIRGFVGQPFSGDHGVYLRNDLSLSAWSKRASQWLPWIDVSLNAFFDFGYVKSMSENIYGRHEESLSGLGVNVVLFYQTSSLSLTLASPIHASQNQAKGGQQVSLSFNTSF